MSEKKNCKARDLSKYDTMDTTELEEILRQAMDAPDMQESDTERILYIAGVLAKRENKNDTGNEARIAWESFEKDYLPIEDCEEYTDESRRKVRPWVRRLATAAAVFILLVGISATIVGAIGWKKVWNAVARWSKGTFSFVSDSNAVLTKPAPRTAQKYTSLKEALEATAQKSDMIPTQIPEGFVMEELVLDESPMQTTYAALYKNGERQMWITVKSHISADPEKIEMNEDIIEVYRTSGSECYIFSNNEQLHAAWTQDTYECIVSGDLTLDEIKTMIDSIGKG